MKEEVDHSRTGPVVGLGNIGILREGTVQSRKEWGWQFPADGGHEKRRGNNKC